MFEPQRYDAIDQLDISIPYPLPTSSLSKVTRVQKYLKPHPSHQKDNESLIPKEMFPEVTRLDKKSQRDGEKAPTIEAPIDRTVRTSAP